MLTAIDEVRAPYTAEVFIIHGSLRVARALEAGCGGVAERAIGFLARREV